MMTHFQDNQKIKAAGLPPLTALSKTLNSHNTSSNNKRAITLSATSHASKSAIEFRHVFWIMYPTAHTQELRDIGHEIMTVRVTEIKPDSIKHKSITKYVLRGSNHGR